MLSLPILGEHAPSVRLIDLAPTTIERPISKPADRAGAGHCVRSWVLFADLAYPFHRQQAVINFEPSIEIRISRNNILGAAMRVL